MWKFNPSMSDFLCLASFIWIRLFRQVECPTLVGAPISCTRARAEMTRCWPKPMHYLCNFCLMLSSLRKSLFQRQWNTLTTFVCLKSEVINAFLFHALQTVELIHRIIPQLPPLGVSCHRKIVYIQCMTLQTVTLSSAGALAPVHCRFSHRYCVQDQDSGNNTLAVLLRVTKCMYVYIWNKVCYA